MSLDKFERDRITFDSPLKLIIWWKNDRKVVIFGRLERGAIFFFQKFFFCYIYIGLYFCLKVYGFFPTSLGGIGYG